MHQEGCSKASDYRIGCRKARARQACSARRRSPQTRGCQGVGRQDGTREACARQAGAGGARSGQGCTGQDCAANAPAKTAPAKPAATKSAPTKTAPAKTAPAKAPVAAKPKVDPAAGPPDKLILIKGIGPVNERKLNEHGVFRFAQIAAWTKADIAAVEAYLAFDGRIAREDWIGQARALAKSAAKPAQTKRGGAK